MLLERYVDGREMAVGLLEQDGEVQALPVVEAIPKEEYFFDFEARYEIGKTNFTCPADLPADVARRVQDIAVAVYRLLGCYGFARVDMILTKDGEPQVLEGQAIPGLTETSLLPQAAEAAGHSFEQLIELIIEQALARPGTFGGNLSSSSPSQTRLRSPRGSPRRGTS